MWAQVQRCISTRSRILAPPDHRTNHTILVGIGSIGIALYYSFYDISQNESLDVTEPFLDRYTALSSIQRTICQEVSNPKKITTLHSQHDSISCCKQHLRWIDHSRILMHRMGMGLSTTTRRLLKLSEPRILTPRDPIFLYPELIQGLKQRSRDEYKLRDLSHLAKMAHQSGDPIQVAQVMYQISQIAYGDQVTPQMREDFCVRYGCTGWTEEILQYLMDLCISRGIVEIGAGHGQWARILTNRYEEEQKKIVVDTSGGGGGRNYKRSWDFVLAFDTMTDLPLSPHIYHNLTQPAKDFFFSRVRQCSSHVDAVRRMECRSRVLLLVYPPPGNMALETVEAYVDAHAQNDTIVYVGEGKGGANANNAFFDYFLKSNHPKWCILKSMNVLPPLGGKGYEKVFVLRRMDYNQSKEKA